MKTRQRIASIWVCLLLNPFFIKASEISLMPVSPAWQIDDLAEWLPLTPYWLNDNRSFVPLKKRPLRFGRQTMIFHSQTTSGQLAQGVPYAQFSVFTNWQLADIFVYWAGSKQEGIVVPPPVYWIEQGHKNGVPVYGVVNLQPLKYGGEYSNLQKLLIKNEDNGTFPLADRLIAIAETLGFDGWFINQETEGGSSEYALRMAEFLRYFMERSPKHISLIWYDAMTKNGKINHQGVLNTLNHLFFWAINPSPGTGRMMIDYRWNEHSLLCDHHESYQWEDSYLFYGIDAHWEKYITPRFKSLASRHRNLALFASNWHFNNDALPSQNYETAQNYWRGTDGGDWPGVCSLVDSKPMIHSMPFSTDFNRGQGGSFYYHRGQPLEVLTASGYGWTQPQQQTPLPDTCGQKNRNARLDVKSVDITGFQGSGAIRLTPASSSESRIDLFSASYRLQGDEEIFLTYKHSNDGVYPIIELQLSYGLSKELYLPTCDKNWCTASLGLGELLGQMLQSVAVKIPAGFAPSVLDIGQLKLFKEATLMAEPPGVWISEQQTYNNRQQIRVSWKENSNADHYLLFTLDHNAQPEKFIGQTHHTSWVIDIPENISINRIGVLPVSIEGSQGIMGIIDI